MSYATVGHCQKCGSPVYAESPWFGVIPPPSRPSCGCNYSTKTVYINTPRSLDGEDAYPKQKDDEALRQSQEGGVV